MSRQAHEREFHDGRDRKPKPHEVGVQIPCGIHSEVAQKNAVRAIEAAAGEVLRRLAAQKESRIEEGHLMSDHVHMMIAIPPKYAVSQVVGYIKGKSAIHLARVYGEPQEEFCRAALLGERLLCFDGGPGRSVDPGIHPEPGA